MNILFLGPECENIEKFLVKQGIDVFRTEESITIPFLENGNFDFCISYRYKKIIKRDEISWFKGKMINLHISYLPYNRGYDPNFWSFFDDTPSGVTIHLIDQGIDTGKILLQKKIFFDKLYETLRTTYIKLSEEIESLFIENFHDIISQKIIPHDQQGEGSFHLSTDKNKFMHLLHEKSWDTPVLDIYSYGKRFRETTVCEYS